MIVVVIACGAIVFNLWIAFTYTGEQPGDSKVYAQLATNLLEQGIFSTDAEAPYNPTLIRLPGYPFFLAGVYYIFGAGNDSAVFAVQGLISVATAVIAAMLAWNWRGGTKRRRRRAAFWTFVFAGFCPFIVNFSSVVLTEILTIFFMSVTALLATYALKSHQRSSYTWWLGAGLAAGTAVLLRPDSGLFAFGIGLTLLLSFLINHLNGKKRRALLFQIFAKGAVFSLAFALVLLPWTIRNEMVFGVFQPLAPTHAEMPGEFVPKGYYLWVRTWIDDARYIGPMLWNLEIKPIKIDDVPSYAFSSDDERRQVAALLDQYNNSDPENPYISKSPDEQPESGNDDGSGAEESDKATDENSEDANNSDDVTDDNAELDLKISPESDAAFALIAQNKIASEPARFYLILPAKRAVSMWFDTHSDYYAFDGELFPLSELDEQIHQEFWLPLFAGIVWFYTVLSFLGAALLAINKQTRLWLVLILLMSVPRILFFSTLENPEPRYYMELFIFAAILGGIVLSRIAIKMSNGIFSIKVLYGRKV